MLRPDYAAAMAARPSRRIAIKRVYEAPSPGDGRRILVDRLWPRGLSKDAAKVDFWAKVLAPSDALRKRVHADPAFPDDAKAFADFDRAYRAELAIVLATPEGAAALGDIKSALRTGPVTLLFGLKNEERNHAAILRDVLVAT